jgi:hypothetical protein
MFRRQAAEDLAQIPDKSRKENVKAAAGTAQAQEALIENSIPTMAKLPATVRGSIWLSMARRRRCNQ